MKTELLSLLMDVEAELRSLQCWDVQSPSAEALASVQPFCVDTLAFNQWLQWIFIPRMSQMLEQNLPLPKRCGISPMVEEWGRAAGVPTAGLAKALLRIDQLLSEF